MYILTIFIASYHYNKMQYLNFKARTTTSVDPAAWGISELGIFKKRAIGDFATARLNNLMCTSP